MYYRENGRGRRLCKCEKCGNGPISIIAGAVAAEPCDECGGTLWLELTEQQFASEIRDFLELHSNYLAAQMKNLSEEDSDSEEWVNALRKLVEGLEGFGAEPTAKWLEENLKKHPKLVEYMLDEFYTRDFLGKARKMVERTTKLAPMIPRATPEPRVTVYLREATRSYVAGFWQSSVILSRSALEIALAQRLKEVDGDHPLETTFEMVVETAHDFEVIDDAHFEMAKDVSKAGNDVVHGSPANEDLAEHVLWNTRGILDRLYSR
jgi:HEPN domain-containing protein